MSGFKLISTDAGSGARAGEIRTLHGTVPTPAFMPVGSQATVKAVSPDELEDIGAGMILANTYHLYLRPGMDVVEKMGGLHKFMGWDRAILTDSGGYQIFSLARLRKINDDGVVFRSHIDGSEHFITPELDIKLQEALGADIIMALDECPANDDSLDKVAEAMHRTHLWAERCLKAKKRSDQELYAIVQGGVFPELRRRSVAYLKSLDFPGYAIGGLSLGEPKKVTLSIVEETVKMLPEARTRYLMGVGSPEDIVEGVARGCDIFDCALPTRVARNGAFFARDGRHNIRNAVYRRIEEPMVDGCNCYTCRHFSAAYVHHLFACEELLGYRLMTIHNLSFMNNLVSEIRASILNGGFKSFREGFLAEYRPTDEQVRLNQKQKWLKSRHSEYSE